jgi:molybdopterin synthase sulfur carrier subunit
VPAVFIPALLEPLAGGRRVVPVEGATVGEAIDNLERACPGIRERLLDGGRLRAGVSVAVDGEIAAGGLREPVSPSSEIHFVVAVRGG